MDVKEKEFIRTQLVDTPPVPCDFRVGDIVTYTNDQGVAFKGRRITGFARDNSFYGRFVHLEGGAYWFPAHPDSLKKEKPSPSEAAKA